VTRLFHAGYLCYPINSLRAITALRPLQFRDDPCEHLSLTTMPARFPTFMIPNYAGCGRSPPAATVEE
jgi:hypothetical protein